MAVSTRDQRASPTRVCVAGDDESGSRAWTSPRGAATIATMGGLTEGKSAARRDPQRGPTGTGRENTRGKWRNEWRVLRHGRKRRETRNSGGDDIDGVTGGDGGVVVSRWGEGTEEEAPALRANAGGGDSGSPCGWP